MGELKRKFQEPASLHFMKQFSIAFVVVISLLPLVLTGQRGGEHVYTFLKLPPSSRIAAMGGELISVRDADPALAIQNPAALNAEMHHGMTFQYHFLFDGISDGYAGFAKHYTQAGITAHAGMQFIQYGEFDLADEYGNRNGTFKANELALTVGAARQLGERLSAGANLRFVHSNLESYNSNGLLMDIGGSYDNPGKRFTLGLAVRNVGVQLSTYYGVTDDLPVDVLLGMSKRLEYLPFRFSVTAHNLHKWDLLYDSPLRDSETTVIGEAPRTQSGFGRNVDNAFRHLIFGGEFLLGKQENLNLRFGYNHRRRKEMTVGTLRSFAGFSLGVGIRIKQFAIDYSFASHHIAGSTKHIGISTNLSRFRKGILE
jgi:hypothetical protein